MQNLTTTDLLIAFFSGVGATLFGFMLTMFWENYKIKQEEKAIFGTIKRILTTNINILKSNESIVRQEIEILKDHKSVVTPLNTTSSDFMNLLSIHMPKQFRKNSKLLEELNRVAVLFKDNNETIKSREAYRINNGAMSNYNTRIAIYDESILRQITELTKFIKGLIKKLR